MRLYRPLLPLALTAILSAPAAAQVTRAQATFYAPDPSAPELANAYLTAHPGDALEIVTFSQSGKDSNEFFYAFGPASRSRAGVCRFIATQIFPHRAEGTNITWDSMPPSPADHVEPPYAMASLAEGECPRRGEEAYTSLDDVSDAQFVTIAKFWKDIAGSPEKFDQAAAYLPFILSNRLSEQFTAFRSAALGSGGAPPRLRAVLKGGVDTYDLAFGQSADEAPNFFLSIGKAAAGFQMLNFQTQF
jgi:hypothetical protein